MKNQINEHSHIRDSLLKRSFLMGLAIVLSFYAVIAGIRLSYPELSHGDEFPDADALISGENFEKFGFYRLKWLPVHEPSFGEPGAAYTHYPPLPNWFNAGLRILFGMDSIQSFRAVSLLLNGLAIAVFCVSLRILTGSTWIASVSSILYIANPWAIANMDALHNQVYSDLVRNIILLLGSLYFADRLTGKQFLIGCGVIGFIQGWCGFESNLFSAFMVGLLAWISPKKSKTFILGGVFVFLGETLSFLLHVIRNAWYFGSFQAAITDMRETASLRAFDPSGELGRAFSISGWIEAVPFGFTEKVSTIPALLVVVALVWVWIAARNLLPSSRLQAETAFRLALIMLFCAYTWYIPMASHTLEHSGLPFLPRHLVPFIALLAGTACFVFREMTHSWNDAFPKRLVQYVPVMLLAATWTFKSELPITPSRVQHEKDFQLVAENLYSMRDVIPEGSVFGVNFMRHRFIQYYTNRKAVPLFNDSDLLFNPEIEYFAFVPIQGPGTQALLDELRRSFILIKECPSPRFPIFWFKRK